MIGQYTLVTLFKVSLVPNLEFLQIEGFEALNAVILAVLLLAASYLTGHLGAFFSTYVVERFVHNALGYPSEIWIKSDKLQDRGKGRSEAVRDIFKSNISNYYWCMPSIIVGLVQAPLFVHHVLFKCFLPVGFYMPALPVGLLNSVKKAFAKIDTGIVVSEESRWEKLVEHFVANNCPIAYARMYNYLVIYGALRLFSFILIVCCWVIVAKSVHAFFANQFTWVFSPRRILLWIGFSTSAFFSMLAFAKFNRRYFEEALLAFLLATDVRTSNAPESKS